MPIINVDLSVDKDKYPILGGKGKRTYSKLEFEIRKGDDVTIEASEIKIDKLDNVNLLLLKTKDDKYDANINYDIIFAEKKPDYKKIKLKKAMLLWLNMNTDYPENPEYPDKPGITFVEKSKDISSLRFWIADPQPDENNGSKNQPVCVNEVTVELVVVRTISLQPNDQTDRQYSSRSST